MKINEVDTQRMTEDKLTCDIQYVSTKALDYMLYNSTISPDDWFYADCAQVIENGDILARMELYALLSISQRDSFYEAEVLSVKAINKRLDYILSKYE